MDSSRIEPNLLLISFNVKLSSKFNEIDGRISMMWPPYAQYVDMLKNKEF